MVLNFDGFWFAKLHQCNDNPMSTVKSNKNIFLCFLIGNDGCILKSRCLRGDKVLLLFDFLLFNYDDITTATKRTEYL